MDIREQVGQFIELWENENISHISQLTSGSTGTAKEILLSKKMMIHSAQRTIDFFNLKARQRALLCISPKFIGGKMMIIRAQMVEMNLVIYEVKNDLSEILDKNLIIDFAAMVPSQLYANYKHPNFHKIKQLIIGGAPVRENFISEIKGLKTKVYSTYGMTETASHIALRSLNHPLQKKFTLLEGLCIEKDDRNCLVVSSETFDDKTIITNDIIDLMTLNSFRIKGRFDNVINTGGIKIHPEEVEFKILQALQIKGHISALKDEKWGEQVVFVVAQKDEIPGNFLSNCATFLDKAETPKRLIRLKNIPKSANGKVLRRQLRATIQEN